MVAEVRKKLEDRVAKVLDEVWTEPFIRAHIRAAAGADIARAARRVLPEPPPPTQLPQQPTVVVINSSIPNTPIDGVHDYRPVIEAVKVE